MRQSDHENLSLLETVGGLIFEPRTTVENLLDSESPPHAVSLFILLLLTIFGPIFYQFFKYGYNHESIAAVGALFVLIVFSIMVFVMIESWLFIIVGIDCGPSGVFACITYTFAPLIAIIAVVYGYNYYSSGTFSVVNLLVSGRGIMSGSFTKALPVSIGIAQLLVLIVFFYAVRYVGKMHSITSLAVACLSLIPFYLAFLAGLFVAESVHQGIVELVWNLILSVSDPNIFRR